MDSGLDAAASRWEWLNLTHLVERAGLDPDRPAVIMDGTVRTYGALRERCRRVANGLLALGIGRGERVAVTSGNRIEYVETELGIAGAAAVMVAMSWRLAAQERISLLAHSQARVVFAEARFVAPIAAARAAGELPDLLRIVAFGDAAENVTEGADEEFEDFCAAAGTEVPACAPPRLDDPHEIIFTSGTTGSPKGAVWSHGTVLWNNIQQVMDFGLRPEHSNYVMLDLNYIGGRHDFTLALLHQGATVHVRRSGGFDAAEALDYITANAVSHVLWVPTMLYDVLRVLDATPYDTSGIEMIMCGGAPLSRDVAERARAAFPHTRFVQVYGLTEGGGTTTFVPDAYLTTKLGSAGKASLHNEIRVVDDAGASCAAGTVGEILVRGPAVTPGYWQDRDATAATIVDGWLHTGDLGHLDDDGFLFVAGRSKDLIITGGMNVYPADVEAVVRAHPSVHDVAVIGLPDERWGERICAVVEAEPGHIVDEAEIIAFCRSRLAGFKKPSSVRVVAELPRTLSGKVRKHLLRAEPYPPA
ncbi:class I adenylate-forming enzyme family protein [Pseudonocardia sp. GCM10023141]|uniref:class I adenylate-forming enzyme family protein n=1 Tax=Pseudonocardia sp. GCM10023141 TaxID=3252653 RepID=UPI0036176119